MSRYEGFTYPNVFYRWPFRWFWKKYMCPQNKHLLDEVWSDSVWYLSCDVCNIEIHISEVNKEYCECESEDNQCHKDQYHTRSQK